MSIIPLEAAVGSIDDLPVFQYYDANSKESAKKKSKSEWPPVPVGSRFKVRVENSKWATKYAASEVTIIFIATPKGVKCMHAGCLNPGFGEVESGCNHNSSLYHCHTHGLTHPPPAPPPPPDTQKSITSFFGRMGSGAAAAASPAADRALIVPVRCVGTTPVSIGSEEASGGDIDSSIEFGLRKTIDSPVSVRSPIPGVCRGYPWPGSEPIADNYPFGLHASQTLNFTASTSGYIVSTTCRIVLSGSESSRVMCDSCALLERNPDLLAIIRRSNDPDVHLTHLKNIYLTAIQQRKRYSHQHELMLKQRFRVFKEGEKALVILRGFTDQKRVLLLLAENKISRVHRVLFQAIERRHASPAQLLKIVTQAALKNYHATGDLDQDEVDKAALVKAMGGPRLLFALHKTDGVASESALGRHRENSPRFVACSSVVSTGIIQHNMESYIFNSPILEKCLWTLSLDSTVIDERMRASMNQPEALGVCPCATGAGLSMRFQSEADIDSLLTLLQERSAHMASEVLAIGLVPNRHDDYGLKMVFAQGICKHADAKLLAEVLTAVIKIWKHDPRGEATRGPLATVQSDGAPIMVRAGHDLFDSPFDAASASMHPVAGALSQCVLFPRFCGTGIFEGMVDGRDGKHNGKRLRTRARTKAKGFKIASAFRYISSYMRRLLDEAKLLSATELADVFGGGNADAQNVRAMILLLTAISGLKDKTSADFTGPPAVVDSALRELRILGEVCSCMKVLFMGKELNIDAHLENLSTLSHLLLVLFRRNGTAFIPAQLYQNLQRMVRSHYWSVQTAIQHGIGEYYLFLDSTDPLEQNFGIVRDLHGSGNQFDIVQFEDRETTAMSIQAIYSRHPEWHSGPRRLTRSMDHWNPHSWLL